MMPVATARVGYTDPMATRLLLVLALAALLGPGPARAGQPCDGANTLGVEPDLLCDIQDGFVMIYARQYPDALKHYRSVSERRPDSPVGPICRAIVYQVIMFEEWDEGYDDTYAHEIEVARERMDRLATDTVAWNHFLDAMIATLEALDHLHGNEHLSAVNRGWEAIEAMRKTRRAAPEFADPDLFLGVFNYYLSAITRRYKGLPSFTDRRDEGFAQMERARDEGLLTRIAARFALAYCYLDHDAYDEALVECRVMLSMYPDNILANSLQARVQIEAGDAEGALATLAAIRRVDPDNKRLPWYMGEVNRVAIGDRGEARRQYLAYLAMPDVPVRYRVITLQQLAEMAEEDGDLDAAIAHLEAALEEEPRSGEVKKELKALRKKRE
jgi:tetratricopeptide (TPR) repeat protein